MREQTNGYEIQMESTEVNETYLGWKERIPHTALSLRGVSSFSR